MAAMCKVTYHYATIQQGFVFSLWASLSYSPPLTESMDDGLVPVSLVNLALDTHLWAVSLKYQ